MFRIAYDNEVFELSNEEFEELTDQLMELDAVEVSSYRSQWTIHNFLKSKGYEVNKPPVPEATSRAKFVHLDRPEDASQGVIGKLREQSLKLGGVEDSTIPDFDHDRNQKGNEIVDDKDLPINIRVSDPQRARLLAREENKRSADKGCAIVAVFIVILLLLCKACASH